MKSSNIALHFTGDALSAEQVAWITEVKGCDEVRSVSSILRLFFWALVSLVQPHTNIYFVRRANAAKRALSNRFTRFFFQEVSVIDFYIDERFLATRCLQGSFFLRSDVCARKLREKVGRDIYCYAKQVYAGRKIKKAGVTNLTKTVIFISQCTPNILDEKVWDKQSEWALKNFKFISQLLPLVAHRGYDIAIKLRDNESRQNQVAERELFANLCSDFLFLRTAADMSAFAAEKNGDVLYLCSHSTMGIDLTLRNLHCLFIHHSIYPGYDLSDFGCDVFINHEPQLALNKIIGMLSKERT